MTWQLPLEYGELADLYEAINDQFIDYDEQVAFIREALARWRPDAQRVLDIGCATGPHARRLAEHGLEVVGIDVSPRLIATAQRSAEGRERLDFLVADGATLPFGEAFDAAICLNFVFSAFLTNAEVWGAAEGIADALRPGGLLVLDHHAFFPPPVEDSAKPPPANPPQGFDWEETCRLGEVELRVRHRQRMDYFEQVCEDEMTYQFVREGEVVRELASTEGRRVIMPQDLMLLLALAGLETIGCFERWDLARESRGPTLALVARRCE
jgi:SAM-dependent methyltransferase